MQFKNVSELIFFYAEPNLAWRRNIFPSHDLTQIKSWLRMDV